MDHGRGSLGAGWSNVRRCAGSGRVITGLLALFAVAAFPVMVGCGTKSKPAVKPTTTESTAPKTTTTEATTTEATTTTTSPPKRKPTDVAKCKDGTYSGNQDFSAACSAHGGVTKWLAPFGECKDGTAIKMSADASCGDHGGFKGLLPSNYAPPVTAAPPTTAGSLYPNRVNRQSGDHEVSIGDQAGARLAGYTAVITAASFRQSVSSFDTDGYIVADATITLRADGSKPYNLLDWQLQTPSGQVLDPEFTVSADELGSGSLVKGGHVSGQLIFKVGAERGQFFLLYKPDPFNADRGVFGVTI